MPKLDGLEATRQIKKREPRIGILVLTVHDNVEHVLKILEAGANGYLTKSIFGDKLIHAIRSVTVGESVFSDEIKDKLLKHALHYEIKQIIPNIEQILNTRELEIIKLVAKGFSNKQIAQELNLNIRTIKGHLVNIFSKLNVNSRTEAVMIGLRAGLLTLDDIN